MWMKLHEYWSDCITVMVSYDLKVIDSRIYAVTGDSENLRNSTYSGEKKLFQLKWLKSKIPKVALLYIFLNL